MKRNRRNFDFLALQVLSRNIGSFLSLGQGKIRSFLSLGLESSISGNIRNIFRVFFFFYFSNFEISLMKFCILSARKFRFPKYKKSFFWENLRKNFFWENIKKISERNFFRGKFWEPKDLQLYWKETPTQVFSSIYCEIFKNSFFIELLQWLLLQAFLYKCVEIQTSARVYGIAI